jgi:outer membrane receptor protein involved in Fe transport
MLEGYTANGQVSPRVNVVWKPDEDLALHAGYSRYFTPPSLELVSGSSISKFANTTGYPAGYSPSSPPQDGPILPERSNYYDVGAEKTVLPGLKVTFDAYAKIAQDLIDEGQFGAPIILAVFNYSRANVYGAEIGTSYNTDNLSIYANFASGREKAANVVSQQYNFSPDDLAYIANHYIYTDHNQWVTASAGVSYSWLGTRFSADAIYGTGLREDSLTGIPNGANVAPYLQLNLGVSHRFDETPVGLPVEWSADLINATDRDYLIRSGSGVGVFAPQYGPHRAIYSSVRAFF